MNIIHNSPFYKSMLDFPDSMMRKFLITLVAFVGITALISGVLMIGQPDGTLLDLPRRLLVDTPFKNYLIPGILLITVIANSSLPAFYYLITNKEDAYDWSLIGGMLLTGWTIIEIILVHSFQWLQVVYLVAGISILLITFHLKGKL
jgi:hypothetical protein